MRVSSALSGRRPGAGRLGHRDGRPPRVLAVDDDASITDLLSRALRYEGWDVRTAGTGAEAVQTVQDHQPDIVLLDVMLPDMDGLQVLHRLRAQFPLLPVVFLSAKDAVADRVAGLAAGGDDYVTKPFSLEELITRLHALVRRSDASVSDHEPSGSEPLVVGDLALDEDSHQVTRGGQEVRLTRTEFDVLRVLMRNQRQVVTKSQLLDPAWHTTSPGRATSWSPSSPICAARSTRTASR